MWWIAASMAVSAASSYMKNKAENDAGMADAKLKAARLKIAKEKAENAYADNIDIIDQQQALDNLSLDQAEIQAEGDLKSSVAGRGLAGGIVDDMEREVELGVAADRAAAKRQNIASARDNKRGLENTLENIENQKEGLYKEQSNFGVSDALGVIGTGVSAYGAKK